MELIFREADLSDPADRQSIITLLNGFMNERKASDTTNTININIIDELQKMNTTRIYLCEANGSSIGIAVCFIGFSTYKQKRLLNIHDFYIQKDFQGKGIGKQLLAYIEGECIKNDFCRLTLEVYGDNANAIKLYSNCGFIGNEYSENNYLIYAMKKDLI